MYETRRQGNKNITVPVADLYYSRYSHVIGSWLIVGRLNWKQRPVYYRALRDHVKELAGQNLGDTENMLVQNSRAAAAIGGPSTVRVPPAVEPPPLRNGYSPWTTLFQDHADRFYSGIQDLEILRTKMKIPDKQAWENTAWPNHRWTPDPMTLPIAMERHRIDVQERSYGKELRRKGDWVDVLDGVPFRRYAHEFIAIIEAFRELRAPWLDVIPVDDSMHTDEIACRILESQVLAEIYQGRLPSRLYARSALLRGKN